MYKFFIIVVLMAIHMPYAQSVNGKQLLEKAIAYHDPEGNWAKFKNTLHITMETPDGTRRDSEVSINIPGQFFELKATKNGITTGYTLAKGKCTLTLNGKTGISEADKEKHRLSCERAKLYRDYYTYLYGLPMKLKDAGTNIDDKVERRSFKGKDYLVLKVTYDADVGSDTWYFYFDPDTYAMEVYQFFKNEAKKDGEYILLSGAEMVNNIKMPKVRAWYYNKDDKYLGTDTLTNKK